MDRRCQLSKRCILTMPHNRHAFKKQQGSGIVVAIFVIVIISLLGASLVSLQRDNAQSANYDVYAARAYLSAYSAGEVALSTLFPLGNAEATPTNCSESSPTNIAVDLGDDTGFHGCSASYQCQTINPSSSSGLPTRYKVVSTAVCQNAQIITRRQLTLEAVSL